MLTFNQTPIQCRIEYSVSNGLGFGGTKYLYKNNTYRDYLTEDEVKNTIAGLDAHLAEMNFDRELSKYFDLKKNSFLGKIRARFYYSWLQLKHGNLRDDAINEAVYNRGGLMNMILEKKFNFNPLYFIDSFE